MNFDYTVLGNGSWATAIVKMLTDNQLKVSWWMRNTKAVEHLRTRHHNPDYLSSVNFDPASIYPTDDINEVLSQTKRIIFAVPSAFVEEVIEGMDLTLLHDKTIISAIKGILPEHNLYINEFLFDHLNIPNSDFQFISGPCHAEEVAQERLSYLTVAGLQDESVHHTMTSIRNPYLRTIGSRDVSGTQSIAVMKNIYALGGGIIHGLGYGDNFSAVYAANAYQEAFHYLQSHDDLTPAQINTSVYLGDLLVTIFSLHSRNRMFGTMIGKGYSVKTAKIELGMIAEGYYASQAFAQRESSILYQLPIIQSVYDILWQSSPADQTIVNLEDRFI